MLNPVNQGVKKGGEAALTDVFLWFVGHLNMVSRNSCLSVESEFSILRLRREHLL